MPVKQYDSTTASDIPVNAEAVAGYDPSGNPQLDAGIAWSQADWDRFATPHKLHIARFAFMDGDCLDVETGDATSAQAGPWAGKRIAAGLARPWVYVNLSNWDATRASCAGLPVRWWVSNPTGIPHIVPGSDMTQYAFSNTSGGHYDLSLALDGALDGGINVTLTEKQTFVRLAYSAFLWRVPPTDQRDYWAGQILDDGSNLDAIMAAIEDSDEGNVLKTLRSHLLQYAQAQSFPGATAPDDDTAYVTRAALKAAVNTL